MSGLHDPAMFQANMLFMAHIPACCAMLALLLSTRHRRHVLFLSSEALRCTRCAGT